MTADITIRNAPFSEELVAYVQRMCEQSDRALGKHHQWRVTVERLNRRAARVEVCASTKRDGEIFAVGLDEDARTAACHAFAFLGNLRLD